MAGGKDSCMDQYEGERFVLGLREWRHSHRWLLGLPEKQRGTLPGVCDLMEAAGQSGSSCSSRFCPWAQMGD